jgi:hypothetical protein
MACVRILINHSLAITCRLQSFGMAFIGRPIELQKETELYGSVSDRSNGLATFQNSLKIAGCSVSLLSMKIAFDSNSALFVINQTLPKEMSMSIENLKVLRESLTAQTEIRGPAVYRAACYVYIY